MTYRTVGWIIGLFIMAGVPCGFTQNKDDMQKQVQDWMKRIDKNNDKKISSAEWNGAFLVAGDFELADQGGDGSLGEDELETYLKAKGGNAALMADLQKKLHDRKEKARKEEEANRKKNNPQQTDNPGTPHTPPAVSKAVLEDKSRRRADFEVKESDANKDGKISADEWIFDENSFDAADKNNDQKLTREELIAYFYARLAKKTGALNAK